MKCKVRSITVSPHIWLGNLLLNNYQVCTEASLQLKLQSFFNQKKDSQNCVFLTEKLWISRDEMHLRCLLTASLTVQYFSNV